MMRIKLALTIIIFILSLEVWAQNTLYCSHPELCRMIRLISREHNLRDIQTENLVSITGDPHQFEPSVLEIKKLISAPILITGPSELNPWIKKIKDQRKKIPKLLTFSILLDQNDYLNYPEAKGEVLSHFWLYPKVYCSLKSKMEADLKKLGHVIKSKKPCDADKPQEQLRSILKRIKKPIILTHDAILPLFLNLIQASKQQIIAIKGSGHHQEASPESVKKMYNALAAPQVIWILEMGINIPENIINKMRPKDIVIKIDTANTKEDDAFSVLTELTEKLTPYAEK